MTRNEATARIDSLRNRIALQTSFLWRTESGADRRKARAAIAAYTAEIEQIQDTIEAR